MPNMNKDVSVNKKDLLKRLEVYVRYPHIIAQDLDNLMQHGVPPTWDANKEVMHGKINDAWQKRQGITSESALYTPASTKSKDHSIQVSLDDIKNMLENYMETKNPAARSKQVEKDRHSLEIPGASIQSFFREHGKENDARNVL